MLFFYIKIICLESLEFIWNVLAISINAAVYLFVYLIVYFEGKIGFPISKLSQIATKFLHIRFHNYEILFFKFIFYDMIILVIRCW